MPLLKTCEKNVMPIWTKMKPNKKRVQKCYYFDILNPEIRKMQQLTCVNNSSRFSIICI